MGQRGSLPSNPRDAVQIAVRLHCVWDARLQAPEEACRGRIVAEDAAGPSDPVMVFSQDRPAVVSVHAGSTLTLTLFAGREGGAPLGQLVLPMRHAVQKCGTLMYHTWFLLDTHSILGNAMQHMGDDVTAEQRFDQALRFAPRQMFQSKICLSICGAQSQEAMSSFFEASATPEQRDYRFKALSLSHRQHVQLHAVLQQHTQVVDRDPDLEMQLERKREKVRLLKEQSLAQQTEIEVLERALQDVMKKQMSDVVIARKERQEGANGFEQPDSKLQDEIQALEKENSLLSQQVEAASSTTASIGGWEEEKLRLQKEIVGVTDEANARIDRANESITMLKNQIKTRHVEVSAVEEECKALERKERQEQGELERLQCQDGLNAESEAQEIKNLKREIEVTIQQKDHLMRIVSDLYGTLGAAPAVENASVIEQGQIPDGGTAPSVGGGYPAAAPALPTVSKDPAAPPQAAAQGFNLLPSPDQLMESGGGAGGGGFRQF